MRRNKGLLVMLLVLLLALCGGCRKKEFSYYAYTGNVTVNIGIGYEGIVQEGFPLPVMVHVEGEYASSGKWCVLSVPTNEADYYSYRVELDQTDHQDICYAIPVAQGSSQLVVELWDEQQNVIYSRTCTYRTQSDWQSMILSGRLDEQTDSISWPQSIATEERELVCKCIIFNGHSPFTEAQAYQMLDFLVTDSEMLSGLSGQAQQAMEEWIRQGGCLIVENSQSDVVLGDIQLSGLQQMDYPVNESIVLSRYFCENGMIWNLDQSLSQLFPRITDYQKEQLILSFARGSSGLYTADPDSNPIIHQEQQLTQILAAEQIVAQSPNVWAYLILLAVYLVIAIPVLYLLLLRKQQVGWFRPAVCVLALFFFGVIYLAGSRTRFSEPFLRCLTILQQEEGGFREELYVRAQAPFNTQYAIAASPAYQVRAVQDHLDWKQDNTGSSQKHTAELVRLEDQTQITLRNLVAFSSRYFRLEQHDLSLPQLQGSVKATLSGETDGSGMLTDMTNATELTLQSAVVVLGDLLYLVENWKPGETLDWTGENNRIHPMSKRQFLEGGFKNRGDWKGRLSEYYSNLIQNQGEDSLYVMAEIAYEPNWQMEGGYQTVYDTILLLKPEFTEKEE